MTVDRPEFLLPYQKAWVADSSPLKICEKSRQVGITYVTALEAVLQAGRLPSAGGTDVWYMGTTEGDARGFIEDTAMWAKGVSVLASNINELVLADEDEHGNHREIQAFRITFPSGKKATAMSSNPRRIRGKRGYLICDESAFHDDLDAVLKAAIAFTMWGGRVALISTHNGTDSQFYRTIEEVRAGVRPGSLHRVPIDEALAQGLYKRICLRLGRTWTPEAEAEWRSDLFATYGEHADEELNCIARGSGGRIFSRRLLESCTHDVPVARLTLQDEFAVLPEAERHAQAQRWCEDNLGPILEDIPKWRQLYFGEDFGRVSDLSVLAPMYITENMRRVVPFLVEMRNVPIDQQRQVVFYVLDHFHSRRKLVGGYFDAGGNGGAIAEFAAQRYGMRRIQQIHLAGGLPRDEKDRTDSEGIQKSLRYAEAIPTLKTHFEDNAIRIPKSLDVIQDFEMFERVNGIPVLPNVRVKSSDRGYRHGDAGVAIMLADYATVHMSPGGDVGYMAASPMDSGIGSLL